MLIDVEKASSKFDLQFIKENKNKQFDNIFFLVNKADQLNEDDVAMAIEDLSKNLTDIIEEPAVIKMSALSALYGELLKKGHISVDRVNKIPTLRSIYLDGRFINSNEPGYPESLIRLSNIRSLENHLCNLFNTYLVKSRIRSIKQKVIDPIMPALEVRVTELQNDVEISKIDEQIRGFHEHIPQLHADRDRLMSDIRKSFSKIKQAFYGGGSGNSNIVATIYDHIHQEMAKVSLSDLTNEDCKGMKSVVDKVIRYYLTDAEMNTMLKIEYDNAVESLRKILLKMFHVAMPQMVAQPSHSFNDLQDLAMHDLGSSLAGAGFGAVAGGGVALLSTTSLATGATVLGFSTGIGASLPFLASNPVGWAVAAGVGVALIAKWAFNSDDKKKNKLFEKFREMNLIEKAHGEFVQHIDSYLSITENQLISFVKGQIEEKTSFLDSNLKQLKQLKSNKEKQMHSKVLDYQQKIESFKAILRRIDSLERNVQE
jgi:hypothetical protein